LHIKQNNSSSEAAGRYYPQLKKNTTITPNNKNLYIHILSSKDEEVR
jgi:hypothetical protein